MNFLLSDEQKEVQRAVERFLDENLDTVALHRLFDDESETDGHDAKLWRGFAELGVLGINLSEEDGGLGLEMIDLALVAEVVGSRAAPVPFLGHVLATLAVAWAGSLEQKAKWLPGLIDGSVIASVGWAGEHGNWDPASWSAAQADKLCGHWPMVPGATVAQLFVLGLAGGQLAVVEREAPGVTVTAHASNDRTRRLGTVALEHTTAQCLPGAPDQVERLRDAALVLLAADGFGGATRCNDMAVAYAKERVQFDRPIGQFQAVKHQLADAVIAVEPSRGLYWYAAYAFDHGDSGERAHMAALAKAHIGDLYVAAARRCVEMHGGMGYTWELDVHIFLKRAMFNYSFMGTPVHQRARVATLLGW